jgi:uncharacterized protein YjbI with pentapeptide repeats
MGLLGIKRGATQAPKKASRVQAAREMNGGEFVGQNMTGYDLSGRIVRDASFDHSILTGADLARSTFIGCSFNAAMLTKASLKRAKFENCQFNRVMLDGADAEAAFFGTNAAQPDLEGAGTAFAHAILSGANFTGASLNNAILHDVQATKTNFCNAKLRGASFDRCAIAGSLFVGADLQGADFSMCDDARKVLPPAVQGVVNFYKKIDPETLARRIGQHERWLVTNGKEGQRLVLHVTDLARNKLRGRDLSGADLRQCKLDMACFEDSRFIAADLRGSSLNGTIFRACDLRGARMDTKSILKVRLQDSRL